MRPRTPSTAPSRRRAPAIRRASSTAAEVTDRQRDTIGALTFDAGHHTVYQHAHFEFGLENISRQFVWTRAARVPVLQLRAVEPALRQAEGAARVRAADQPARRCDVYERAVLSAWDSYAELSALLKDDAFAILKELRYVTPRRKRRSG